MKHILCLIENLGSGGAERQLTGLAAMLQKAGYDVIVGYYVKKEFYVPFLQENGVKYQYLSDANRSHKRFFALHKYIHQISPDTIISYSSSPSIITCLLKSFGMKARLIVSERNTTQKLTLREKIRFYCYRWADCIVPNSQSQRRFIEDNYPNLAGKINVITNFVDTEKFCPHEGSISEQETKMICVGRLMPQKNIPRFIEAVSKVIQDGYKLHIDWFGHDLKDGYSQECRDIISKYNLDDSFLFHAPSSNIQDEYCQSDVFCLPSLYEGFPNVLCESMSCGKPVLCSQVCDNPNIVQDGENGLLFDPLNVDDMATTIEHFLDLPLEKRNVMGIKSREIAIDMFSKDSFIRKYISIL